MWQPKSIGDVIAERGCALRRGSRRIGRVLVTFGTPVRSPTPEKGDPWWCPVRIKGPKFDVMRSIAGLDSLQALILALEFATQILPHEAKRMGGEVVWLDDQERIVFARQSLARASEEAIIVLLSRLKAVAEILDSGDKKSRHAAKRSIDALAAIGSSVGHPPPSKRPAHPRRKP